MPQDNPFAKYAKPTGPVLGNPYKPREEQRADISTQMDVRRADIQAQNNAREQARTRLQNAQDLRQEYSKLPEVQKYKIALSQARRAMGTAANPDGDLALTYAVAQAMDPLGSVREGDQTAIAGAAPASDRIITALKKQFGMDESGAYSPESRKRLRREIFNIIDAYKPQYDARRADMIDAATAAGVDPKSVILRDDTEIYAKDFRAYGEKNGDDGTISRIIGGAPIKGATITAPGPAPTGMAGYGATQTSDKIPPQMQQEATTYLNQNWGKLDPQAWADYRSGLDRKYGFNPDPVAYMAEAPKMNDFATKGGRPDQMGPILAPKRDMSGFEQLRNNAVANPIGAGIATAANGASFGIPSLLAGDKFSQLHDAFPKSALAGDIVGGVLGVKGVGGILKAGAGALERTGVSGAERVLTNPLVRDMTYGGVYGANDSAGRGQNAVLGALTGVGGAFLGNRLGNAIGKAFPRVVGSGAVRAADDSVPSSQELKDLAGAAYRDAEAKGLTVTPDETYSLADMISGTLSKEGRLSPAGRITDLPKLKEGYNLVQDYAGQPMTPTQFQAVRSVVADGLLSKEPSERRIASNLLTNVDDWSDAVNPDLAEGLRKARGIASRYIQGDKIAKVDELAEPGATQYGQSGAGNAIRTQFRQLDRNITRGNDSFSPNVEDAVRDVARGTPGRNALRYVGKLAPTGQVGMMGYLGAGTAGATYGGATGAAIPTALALIGTGARSLEGSLAKRAARVAELSAYGGQDYTDRLAQAITSAGNRGGMFGAGSISTTLGPITADRINRALLALQNPGGQ